MVIKILVLFGTMFLLMMIGSPIAVALAVATMVTMTATTNISLTTMSTACLSGLDSFPLMAIPFFMLAGNLMKSGGISRRILDFADAVVGWVTGSVGMVTVVASMFFAALSGSSPATVTAIGGITIPEMKRRGYDPAYATAITAAAGTIGVIIPPSIPFVIYGVAAQCSISDLFLAGIIPGILIGVVLMILGKLCDGEKTWIRTYKKVPCRSSAPYFGRFHMGVSGTGYYPWRNLWRNLYPYGISSSGDPLFHFCRRIYLP